MTQSKNSPVYLDANATHPLLSDVRSGLARALETSDPRLSNPASIHRLGQMAKQEMAELRESLCAYLGRPDGDEFIFLSGATEALNLAIRGFVRERRDLGRRSALLASSVEHSAVLDTVADAGADTAEIVPVDSHGQLDLESTLATLERVLTEGDSTDVLLCLQACNNETGVAFDLDALFKIVTERFGPRVIPGGPQQKGGKKNRTPQRVFLLIDAAQALGKMDESALRRLVHAADYLTLSAHKMGGLSGVGALWLRKGVPFKPLLTGGVQERKRRAGTANSLGLMSFHLALKTWMERGNEIRERMRALRDELYRELASIDGLVVHGLGPRGELPGLVNTLNFHVEGCPEESLLLALDLEGFCVSSGSACNSGSLRPSHVLKAMGFGDTVALSSIRASLHAETTRDDVARFAEAVRAKTQQIRAAREYAREIFGEENPVLEL